MVDGVDLIWSPHVAAHSPKFLHFERWGVQEEAAPYGCLI